MQKERNPSFDALRGVAITAVIAIHSAGLVILDKHPSIDRWNFYFVFAYRQFLLFAVPVFLFTSGYWSSKEQIESFKDHVVFLKKRLSRVLVPYFFWSFILLGYAAGRT